MKFRWKGLSKGKNTIEDVVLEFASLDEIHVHDSNTFDYFLKRR